MSTMLEVTHRLGIQAARERLEQLARKHDVRLGVEPDGCSGTLEKRVGFLGTVRARYRVGETRVEFELVEVPALVPVQSARRLLEEELARAFSAGEGGTGG